LLPRDQEEPTAGLILERAVGHPPEPIDYGPTDGGADGAGDLHSQLDVLLDLCHAFASAPRLSDVAEAIGLWVRKALATDQATFRLLVADEAGRLRTIASDQPGKAGKKRSEWWKAVFREQRPARLEVTSPAGALLAMIPLVSRGQSVGVLEVAAPRARLEARWKTLQAVASQVAIAVRNLRERARLERQQGLLREVVAASTPKRAILAAVRLCFESLKVPVVAWGVDGQGSALELVEVRGLDAAIRQRLRSALRTMPLWERQAPSQRDAVSRWFEGVVAGTDGVTIKDAGDALLLIPGRLSSDQAFLDTVVGLLRGTLRTLRTTDWARRRNDQLDTAIAWTAHELRRPLISLRFLVASLGEDPLDAQTRADIQLLQHELDGVVQGVDGMLKWATGSAPGLPQLLDIRRLVEDVAASSRVEWGNRARIVAAPPSASVYGDAAQLRHALDNVVRNALIYSPPDTPVAITIDSEEKAVTVTVRDQGPGVPAAYRETIFDPFVRGGGGRHSRSGHGLGLFIARQVVERHGGSIWLEPRRTGAMFRLRLPSRGEGRTTFDS
jgi:signal transduction histidine kinase